MRTITITALALVASAILIFSGYEIGKPSPVPVLTDSTTLKAELQARDWQYLFTTINRNASKIRTITDTSEARKSEDTIHMALGQIVSNIQDAKRNPVFKK
jgi:hypothetical protein